MTATLDQWLAACRAAGLRMRRQGRAWCGPCPVCQAGDDRFALREGDRQAVIAHARCGHTFLEILRALDPEGKRSGEGARPCSRPVRPRPAAGPPPDPRTLPQARNAQRILRRAHRGRPTYYRRKFPHVDHLVWSSRDGGTWLVPLQLLAAGRLLPGVAGLQYILEDGSRRFQKDSNPTGLVAAPRWRDAGPLVLAEGVTSALAICLAVPEPPVAVVACLSRTGLVAVSGRLGTRPAMVIADRDLPDKRGIEHGTESAQKTGLPLWLPREAPADAWDVWRRGGAELERMREWITRKAAEAPEWPAREPK